MCPGTSKDILRAVATTSDDKGILGDYIHATRGLLAPPIESGSWFISRTSV